MFNYLELPYIKLPFSNSWRVLLSLEILALTVLVAKNGSDLICSI